MPGYLTTNPSLVKRVNNQNTHFSQTSSPSGTTQKDCSLEEMAQLYIRKEEERVKELEMQLAVYEVKIAEEERDKIDPGSTLAELDSEVEELRREEDDILQQVDNCKLVENHVTPVEYYLWKKKQRISTYDISVAALCADIEAQRSLIEASIDDYRKENEMLTAEIEDLE